MKWEIARCGGMDITDEWVPSYPARYTIETTLLSYQPLSWTGPEMDSIRIRLYFRTKPGRVTMTYLWGGCQVRGSYFGERKVRSIKQAIAEAEKYLKVVDPLFHIGNEVYRRAETDHVYRVLEDGTLVPYCSLFRGTGCGYFGVHTLSRMIPGEYISISPDGVVRHGARCGSCSYSGQEHDERLVATAKRAFRWTEISIPPVFPANQGN